MNRLVRYGFVTLFSLIFLPSSVLSLQPKQWDSAAESAIPDEWQAALDTRIAQLANKPIFTSRIKALLVFMRDAVVTPGLSFTEHSGLAHQVRAGVLSELRKEKQRLEDEVDAPQRRQKIEVLDAVLATISGLSVHQEHGLGQAKDEIEACMSQCASAQADALLHELLPEQSSEVVSSGASITRKNGLVEKALVGGVVVLACVAAAAGGMCWYLHRADARVANSMQIVACGLDGQSVIDSRGFDREGLGAEWDKDNSANLAFIIESLKASQPNGLLLMKKDFVKPAIRRLFSMAKYQFIQHDTETFKIEAAAAA